MKPSRGFESLPLRHYFAHGSFALLNASAWAGKSPDRSRGLWLQVRNSSFTLRHYFAHGSFALLNASAWAGKSPDRSRGLWLQVRNSSFTLRHYFAHGSFALLNASAWAGKSPDRSRGLWLQVRNSPRLFAILRFPAKSPKNRNGTATCGVRNPISRWYCSH